MLYDLSLGDAAYVHLLTPNRIAAGGDAHQFPLVSGLPRHAVCDLISLGEQVLDRVTQVVEPGAQHEERLFEACEAWWCPWRVIDKVWSENLVENVYLACAPAFPKEFVEALDNGLARFCRHRTLPPYTHAPHRSGCAYGSEGCKDGATSENTSTIGTSVNKARRGRAGAQQPRPSYARHTFWLPFTLWQTFPQPHVRTRCN